MGNNQIFNLSTWIPGIPRAPVRTEVKHPRLRRHSPFRNRKMVKKMEVFSWGGLHVWFKYGFDICWKCMKMYVFPTFSVQLPHDPFLSNFPGLRPSTSLNHLAGKSHGLGGEKFYKARIESGWHKEVQKKIFCVCVFVWVLYSQPEISYQMAGCCQHNWPYVWVKPQDLRDCLRSQPKKNAKSATDYLKQPQKSYGCDPAKPCLKDGGLFLDQVPFHHSGWVRRPLFFWEIQRLLQEWQVLLSMVFHEVVSCGKSPTNRLVTLSFNSSHFFPSSSFTHQTLTLEDLCNRGHYITNQKNARLKKKIPQIHHINYIWR